jgi:hypothetical protein
MSTRNLSGDKGRPAFKADTSPPSVSRLSRRCGSLDLSQPYGPSGPVQGQSCFFYHHHLGGKNSTNLPYNICFIYDLSPYQFHGTRYEESWNWNSFLRSQCSNLLLTVTTLYWMNPVVSAQKFPLLPFWFRWSSINQQYQDEVSNGMIFVPSFNEFDQFLLYWRLNATEGQMLASG